MFASHGRRRPLTRAAVVVGAALGAALLVPLPASAADPETIALNLLNINDFHGRIDANTVKFAGTVEQLRAAYGEANTLFLSDGDNIGASLFASAFEGDEPTLDVLNALDLDVSAVGNHEFDKGMSDLTGRVSSRAEFDYLGANVYLKGTQTPALPEYELFPVGDLTVAVIGAVTEETPSLVSPGGIVDLDFGDPVAAVNRVAAQLTDGQDANGEADVLIAAYHEGAAAGDTESSTLEQELADGKAFADIVQNTTASVDVIFTGHTHKKYAWDAPIPGGTGTRPVLQTGSYGENIGQTVLTLDAATGDVVSYVSDNVARTTVDDATLVDTYPRVAAVKTIVDGALERAAAVGDQPVGAVTADITTAFAGGTVVGGVYTGGVRDNRAAQSSLGNLVADSLVESLSDPDRGGAEIGVVNPGGLRSELLYGTDGVITYAEANAVLPFVNNLWTTTLTGAQFVSALEQQWQPDGSSRPYLALGLSDNVAYTFDAAAARGSRITGVWIDGEPLDPTASYRIGSFSFLLQGGDNFTAFAQGTQTRDSGLIDRDAWIDYLTANAPIAPSFASRSAQVTGVPSSVVAGDTVAFDVAGLDLTSLGAPANTTLTASIGSTVSAPIAVAGGAAHVSLTVPSSLSGAAEIVLTAPASGTVVRVPITVAPRITGSVPTISGTAKVGSRLTARPGTWTSGVALSYRWSAGGTAIAGATSSTFVPTAAQVGKKLTVTVTGTKASATLSKTSKPTAAVAKGTLTAKTPTISGAAKVGSTLTAKSGAWTAGTSFRYQWYANGKVVAGATKATYTPTASVVGKKVTVKVTGSKAGYTSVAKTSAAKTVVRGTLVLSTPKISGTVKVGRTVSATATVTRGAHVSYQWYLDGRAVRGATKKTFTPTRAQAGHWLSVRVTETKSGYHTQWKLSMPKRIAR